MKIASSSRWGGHDQTGAIPIRKLQPASPTRMEPTHGTIKRTGSSSRRAMAMFNDEVTRALNLPIADIDQKSASVEKEFNVLA